MGLRSWWTYIKGLFSDAFHSWLSEYRLAIEIVRGSFPVLHQQEPLSWLERTAMALFVLTRSFSLIHLKGFIRNYRARSQFSESYVILWFVLLLLILFYVDINSFGILAVIVVAYRLIEGFNYRLCILFVDRYASDWGLRSLNRSLILLLINYFEIVIGFAILFLKTKCIEDGAGKLLQEPLDSLYFSIVTITTLGYGDYTPLNETGKALVVLETIAGIVLLLIVVGTFLTGMRGMGRTKKANEEKKGEPNSIQRTR